MSASIEERHLEASEDLRKAARRYAKRARKKRFDTIFAAWELEKCAIAFAELELKKAKRRVKGAGGIVSAMSNAEKMGQQRR